MMRTGQTAFPELPRLEKSLGDFALTDAWWKTTGEVPVSGTNCKRIHVFAETRRKFVKRCLEQTAH